MPPFKPNIPGLQIYWISDEDKTIEHEFISLTPGKSSTVADGFWSGRHHIYTYPVTRKDLKEKIELTYLTAPPQWKNHPEWEYFQGKLVIDLNRAREPISVTWHRYSKDQKYELERGADWEFFSPQPANDQAPVATRSRTLATRVARPEQPLMRQLLLEEVGKCALSGCDIRACLEAAHILPVKNGGDELIENMMLLRADLHLLFDSGDISFDLTAHRVILLATKEVAAHVKMAIKGKFNGKREAWEHHIRWIEARSKFSHQKPMVSIDA